MPKEKKDELRDALYDEVCSVASYAFSLMGDFPAEKRFSTVEVDALPNIVLSDKRPLDPFVCTWGDIKRWAIEEQNAPREMEVRHPRGMDGIFEDTLCDDIKEDGIAYHGYSPRLGDFNPETQTITIYYRNHSTYCWHGDGYDDDKLGSDFLADIFMTLAHEYAHNWHCLFLGKSAFSAKADQRVFVIEPIADYFSYLYMLSQFCSRHNLQFSLAAIRRRDEWCQHYGSPWPYAYALAFEFEENPELQFISVFLTSEKGWPSAFDLLMRKAKCKPNVSHSSRGYPSIPDADDDTWDTLHNGLSGPLKKGQSGYEPLIDRRFILY